jgi:hypothetical protein
MLVSLTNSQQCQLTYGGPVDKKGKPAQVEGLQYLSTDPNAGTFVPGVLDASGAIVPDTATDGMLRGVIVGQAAGVCRVSITADADLGDGVKTITSEIVDVQVTGGEAVGFGAPVAGAVVDQP